jgi:hypothetical protein
MRQHHLAGVMGMSVKNGVQLHTPKEVAQACQSHAMDKGAGSLKLPQHLVEPFQMIVAQSSTILSPWMISILATSALPYLTYTHALEDPLDLRVLY